ncbi:MAG: hypothetical protein GC179_21835 [Anaerolineaceae bacterium]|nr:hypothetical protein [Anaerolineaceae bacterium]
MNDQYLKHVLTRRAEHDIPASVNVSAAVFRQLTPQKTGLSLNSSSSKSHRFDRFRWAALLIIITLISVTTVYAIVQSLIQPDPGIKTMQIERKTLTVNQTHEIALPSATSGTMTVKNLSVTVTEVYADRNRISIGYQVKGLAEKNSGIQLYSNPTLTDAANNAYVWLVGSNQQSNDVSNDALGEHFTHEGIMSFDAALLKTVPASIDLHLQIEVAYTTTNNPMAMALAGKTSFDFRVPMTGGREAQVDESVSSASQTIQLSRAVITPSMTRLEICLSSPAVFNVDAWLSWETSATLKVNGQSIFAQSPAYFSGSNGAALQADAPCRAIAIPESLANQVGQWELTLAGFHNTDSGQTIDGTWTFTFEVN